jgi:hypothetical protein
MQQMNVETLLNSKYVSVGKLLDSKYVSVTVQNI